MSKLQVNLTMVSGDRIMLIPCEEAAHSAELTMGGENNVSLKFKIYGENKKIMLGENDSEYVFYGKYNSTKNTTDMLSLNLEPYMKEYGFKPDEFFVVVKKYKK